MVADVAAELGVRVDAALAAGVDPAALVLDPGLGFAKLAEHNWALLRRLPALAALGFPLLIGASRKRFLWTGDEPAGSAADIRSRDVATVAITTAVAAQEVWGVRVHDVAGSVRAAEVAAALTAEAAVADRPGTVAPGSA